MMWSADRVECGEREGGAVYALLHSYLFTAQVECSKDWRQRFSNQSNYQGQVTSSKRSSHHYY